MSQPHIGETEHFWYHLGPEGIYVDSQCDNKAFGYMDGRLVLSEDCGHTWPHSLDFPEAHNLTFSCILKNGSPVSGGWTDAQLYGHGPFVRDRMREETDMSPDAN